MTSTILRPKDKILNIAEVAAELRCSKAHVHNAINGKLSAGMPFPGLPVRAAGYELRYKLYCLD